MPLPFNINEMRAVVERVCQSRALTTAPRLQKLLRFLSEAALNAEPIKETIVAVSVFDRRPDYDPRLDAVVRTEVRRLRLKLHEYYAGEGSGEPIRIEIPKGRYAVRFEQTQAEERAWPTAVGEVIDKPRSGIRRLPVGIALVWSTVAVTAATLALFFFPHFRGNRSAAAPKSHIAVILPLRTLPRTQDTLWLSTAIGEMLYHELAGASGPGALHLIPPEDAARMDRDLLHRSTGREAVHDVRNYSGADWALIGTVTVLPGQADPPLRIDLHIQDLRTGDFLATSSTEGSEAQTFDMVRSLADQLRPALGALAPSSPTRISAVPTSARAMQLYSEGLIALRSSDPLTARDRLMAAVKADPSNALCYSALSEAWSNLGYEAKAADAARRAFDLSSSLSDLDRLAIEARYRLAGHDWARAAALYEAIWRITPNIDTAEAMLNAYESTGRIDDARHVIARLRALPPPLGDDPRIDILEAHQIGATWSDFSRIMLLAKDASQKAQRRGMRDLYARARLLEAKAMWSKGTAGSDAIRRDALGICQELHDSACVSLALREDGNAYLVAGQREQAEHSYGQALAVANQSGDLDGQLNVLNGMGVLHYGSGDFEGAVRCYREALVIGQELSRDSAMIHNNYANALIAAGRLGEARQQAVIALDLGRTNHEVESQADSLAAIAQLDRLSGDPRTAVRIGREALALAKQSGKVLALIETGADLAIALADRGELSAAQHVLQAAASNPGSKDDLGLEFARTVIAYDAADPKAGTLARATAERARKAQARDCESRAESLLALILLEQGRRDEARAMASRAMSVSQTPDRAISRLEARFVDLATRARADESTAAFAALAGEARKAGYVQLALEIQLTAARNASRPQQNFESSLVRQLETEAAEKGYLALAASTRFTHLQ